MTDPNSKQIENYKQAAVVAKQIKQYIKTIVKKDMPLSEISNKIEEKINELGAGVAFPINLAIDDVAAHYTPSLNDDAKAKGLLKIDIGVHIQGCIIDTAMTLDLTDNKEYKEMIQATEDALNNAIELIKKTKEKTKLNEIGKTIHQTITKAGFSPVRNLSGHSLDLYEIHSGITIPNYDNHNENEIGSGMFAIEPFATTGQGVVYEGSESGIYQLISQGNVRSKQAREILEYIKQEKQTLPFSQRELEKKFGNQARLALKQLEQAKIIKSYSQLIEKSHEPVSQAEHTILITKDNIEVLS